LVGQHLELDVARRPDVFFQVDVGGGECRAGFGLCLHVEAGQILCPRDDAHAAAAAAGGSFENNRVAISSASCKASSEVEITPGDRAAQAHPFRACRRAPAPSRPSGG